MKDNFPGNPLNYFAISDFFQLLSISLRLPDHDLAKALLDGSYKGDALYILEELACTESEIAAVEEVLDRAAFSEDEETSLLIQLRREYTRLFEDPKQPALAIYETLFLHYPEKNNEVMLFISPAALDAERCYKSAGVRLVKQSAEPADHMATELEFMMYLYAKKGKALQEQDSEELVKLEKQIDEFTDLHLNKWCCEFFARLEREAKQSFYQGLCKLAKVGLGKILV